MSSPEETSVLDRLFEPMARLLTPEFARQLVAFRADPEVQDRISTLAERCNEGQLTPEERADYETYVRFVDFLAILQAKARRALAENRTP